MVSATTAPQGFEGRPASDGGVKDSVLGLLLGAYQRRNRVALVTFPPPEASVALPPTSSYFDLKKSTRMPSDQHL